MAREVGDPLAHLVVEDPVVLLGVPLRVGVGRLEEALLADLLVGDGDVCDRELDAGVRPEVVVERGEHGEDVLLVLATRRLVGDVRELDRLREEAFLYLGYAVLVDGVVADVGGDLARLGARLLLSLELLLVGLLGSIRLAGRAHQLLYEARRARPLALGLRPRCTLGSDAILRELLLSLELLLVARSLFPCAFRILSLAHWPPLLFVLRSSSPCAWALPPRCAGGTCLPGSRRGAFGLSGGG